MSFENDERATSPTIGAVLMVAVTVGLAAVTGTHLFGLAGSQQGAFATPAVEYSPSENQVSVTWVSNANAEKLTVRILGGGERRAVSLDDVGDRVVVDGDGVTISSGSVSRWDSPAVSDGDRVTVTVVAVKGGESMVVAERSAKV